MLSDKTKEDLKYFWEDYNWLVFLIAASIVLIITMCWNNKHQYEVQEAKILAQQASEAETIEYPEDYYWDDTERLKHEEMDACTLIAERGYQVLHLTEYKDQLIFTVQYPGLDEIYTKKNAEGRAEAENKITILFAQVGAEIPAISKNCQIIFCVVSDLETETVKFMVENEGISYTCYLSQPNYLPGESEIDLAEWENNIEGIATDYLTTEEE